MLHSITAKYEQQPIRYTPQEDIRDAVALKMPRQQTHFRREPHRLTVFPSFIRQPPERTCPSVGLVPFHHLTMWEDTS
jgi:hypothetical protein